MKPPDWETRACLPRRITSLDAYPADANGFVELPEALYLEGELEWLQDEYERAANPALGWAALMQIEQHVRTHGGAVEYPAWVRDYLHSVALALLTLDPEHVPETKMPNAMAKALRLTTRGGRGYIQQWRRLMDNREREDAMPIPISGAAAADLYAQIDRARIMPTEKHELRQRVKKHASATKRRAKRTHN